MSVIFPEHKSLFVVHNPHHQDNISVETYITTVSGGEVNLEEWTDNIAYQKATSTNELWEMSWVKEGESAHTFVYGPTFSDMMKAMLMKSEGQLVEYN